MCVCIAMEKGGNLDRERIIKLNEPILPVRVFRLSSTSHRISRCAISITVCTTRLPESVHIMLSFAFQNCQIRLDGLDRYRDGSFNESAEYLSNNCIVFVEPSGRFRAFRMR